MKCPAPGNLKRIFLILLGLLDPEERWTKRFFRIPTKMTFCEQLRRRRGVAPCQGNALLVDVSGTWRWHQLPSLRVPGLLRRRTKKPNILVIGGNDVGWQNVSAYGMGTMGYTTPNIDRTQERTAITSTEPAPLFLWLSSPVDPLSTQVRN